MVNKNQDKKIIQANHPYKNVEIADELSQIDMGTKKSEQSIKRDVARKREEIKNSTIGGF